MALKPPGRFVAYYRVSTAQQGRSGLGLEVQRKFIGSGTSTLADEFTEIESGKHSDRPQLARALDACRLTVRLMAMIAQNECERISERTKAALAAAKARGKKLGGNRGGPNEG